jgi:hypothetical protein
VNSKITPAVLTIEVLDGNESKGYIVSEETAKKIFEDIITVYPNIYWEFNRGIQERARQHSYQNVIGI